MNIIKYILMHGLQAAYKVFPPKLVREASKRMAERQIKSIGDLTKKGIKKLGKWTGIGVGLDVGAAGISRLAGGEGKSPVIGPAIKKFTGLKKGGYVKMKKGGSVKKSSFKKSRGIGAAKRGTKFKGVF